MVRAHANERRRDWVTRAGLCAPSAPMWTSRAGWLDGLSRWVHSPAFGQLCAQVRVSITTSTLLSIAAVMAEHADHATGRHVAVTRATIADKVGCDVRTVTAAWRVLRASRWAVEAQRGHGSTTTPSVGRLLDGLALPWSENARPTTDVTDPALAAVADSHRAAADRSWRILTTPRTRDRGRERTRDQGYGLELD